MLHDSVTVTVDIRTSASNVWRFLVVERGEWWPEMKFEAAVGAPLSETWIDGDHEASAEGTVTLCEEPELIGFRWIEPDWEQTLDVVIRLLPQGELTEVTLTESGFARAGSPSHLSHEHEEGWRYHLERLKHVSERHAADGR